MSEGIKDGVRTCRISFYIYRNPWSTISCSGPFLEKNIKRKIYAHTALRSIICGALDNDGNETVSMAQPESIPKNTKWGCRVQTHRSGNLTSLQIITGKL